MTAIRTQPALARARAPRRALLVTLAVLLAGVATVRSAPAQAAQDGDNCLPAGGIDVPFETPDDFDTSGYDLIVNGGGFGHGVGMSQYGAKGAAVAGCTYPTILSTYYPGTRVAPLDAPREHVALHLRRIGLEPTTVRTTAADFGGVDLPWMACDEAGDACETVAVQPAGTDWVVHPRADGQFTLSDPGVGAGCDPSAAGCHWRGGTVYTRLRLLHDGTVVRVVEAGTFCSGRDGLCTKYGWVEFDYTSASTASYPSGQTYVTQYVTGDGAGLSAMDRYLFGLAEVPGSWPEQALRAQAVAGRSYAEATIRQRADLYGRHPVAGYIERSDGLCRCDLFRTTRDQHWTGWDRERIDVGDRWTSAVRDSAGEHVLFDGDEGTKVVTAFYSSSHGGYSDAIHHVWGGSGVAYLQAVDTSRWECLGEDPNQRWTRGFTRDELAAIFGLDSFTGITVEERGGGGRPVTAYRHVHSAEDLHDHPRGAVVTGVVNGDTVTQRYSGEQLRSKLRKGVVSSALMHFSAPPEPDPEPSPSADSGSTTSSTDERSGSASDQPCAPDDPADPPPPDVPPRVAGENRIETAAAVARLGWDSAEVIVIARSDHPADALAGSALAGRLGAPLLITDRAQLSPEVEQVVNELGATSAILLGGEAALSTDVELQLLDRTTVESADRAAGPDRFATAIDIAKRLAPPQDGAAFLVRGHYAGAPSREWPDALAVAGLAAHRAADGAAWPILLTSEQLPPQTEEALASLQTTTVYIVGGELIVPPEVEQRLIDLGYEVVRIAGSDRFATSRAALSLDVVSEEILMLATAQDFPDGLAAGPLAARLGARLLLVPASHQPDQSPWLEGQHPDTLRALQWTRPQVLAVGGPVAISEEVAEAVRQAISSG